MDLLSICNLQFAICNLQSPKSATITPEKAGRGWTAVAVAAWVLLLVGLAILSYCYPRSHTVYDIYARACRHWWAGQNLYGAQGTDYFRYSPLFAISVTPFALLPDSWGGALWRISNGLLYAAGLGAWARRALPVSCSRSQRAALFLLVLPLSMHSMQNGQANVTMLGTVLLGLAAASAEKWNRAAVWLALATLIKGYPLALVLLLAAVCPRGLLLRYTIALALGLLVPFATQQPEVVLGQYVSWWAHLCESTVIMRERLRTLEHLFSIYGYPVSPQAFQLVQLFVGLAMLGLVRWHARRTPELRQWIEGAWQLFACWVALFGPATETCTYIILAPALAWSLVDAFSRPTGWYGRLVLILSFLMVGPLVTDLSPPPVRDFANEHGSQPLGALLYFAYVLLRMTVWGFSPPQATPLPRQG
jgi:hypothetical protein